jgi:hypothetical protein
VGQGKYQREGDFCEHSECPEAGMVRGVRTPNAQVDIPGECPVSTPKPLVRNGKGREVGMHKGTPL